MAHAGAAEAAGGQKNIFVAVRCRPLSLTERVNETYKCVQQGDKEGKVIKVLGESEKENDYKLDRVFWEGDTQENIYDTLGACGLSPPSDGHAPPLAHTRARVSSPGADASLAAQGASVWTMPSRASTAQSSRTARRARARRTP